MDAEKDAQAATIEDGSLVKQSEEKRHETEQQFAEKLIEFADKQTQVEQDLKSNKDSVDALSLADLNRDICGAATEGCDETCGGAGCGQCGGLSCEGAVTVSEEGMSRAKKTQEILDALTSDASELQTRIEVGWSNFAECKMVTMFGEFVQDEGAFFVGYI